MRCRGLVDEKTATLRLKMDPTNDNRNMDDLVAYRVKFCAHPHVGNAWCIYPSYDFTHCIVDALENITHSLCTLEFHIRRPSYFWLLQELGLYMPFVWEYSRLNITNHVMSKRKLQVRRTCTLHMRAAAATVPAVQPMCAHACAYACARVCVLMRVLKRVLMLALCRLS
jgi:glutamyl/glutaminyl-tRNA synthetase